jgi:aspartokinase
MKPLVYKVFKTPGMTRPSHSRKRVTLNVVLSDIGKITQGETDQLVALFDEAQQTALANDILAKRAQAAEEEVTKLLGQAERLRAAVDPVLEDYKDHIDMMEGEAGSLYDKKSPLKLLTALQEALKDD